METDEREKLLENLNELWKMHNEFGKILDEIIAIYQHE